MRGWFVPAVLLAAGWLFAQSGAAAVFQPRAFSTEQDAQRYKTLTEELRCLVCQNQSLADSNAELATDLRERIYSMITEGASNEEIVDFMVARYGNFVRYRPPLTSSTLLLWFGPFLLALLGVALLVMKIRNRSRLPGPRGLSEHEQRRIAELLEPTPNDKAQR
jgi:cytochrome c-type biogenesis protein CcmH